MHSFCDAPLYKIGENTDFQNLRKKYKFYAKHLSRGHNIIWFSVCKLTTCQHCTTIKQDSTAIKLIKSLGGRLYQPVPSEKYPGHFESFIDADNKYKKNPEKMPPIDANQPTQQKKDLGQCNSQGCREFKFLSDSDQDRHVRLAHGGKRALQKKPNINV